MVRSDCSCGMTRPHVHVRSGKLCYLQDDSLYFLEINGILKPFLFPELELGAHMDILLILSANSICQAGPDLSALHPGRKPNICAS